MSKEKFVYELSLRLCGKKYWVLWYIPPHQRGIKLMINHGDQLMIRYYLNVEINMRCETDTLDIFIEKEVRVIDNYFEELE